MQLLELSTAIGKPFDVRRVSVSEGISTLFSIDVLSVAPQHNIDLEAVVGQTATFQAQFATAALGNVTRTWTGWVSSAEQVHALEQGRDGTMPVSTYFLRIVPELWLLKQKTNYRIYQHESIPAIIDDLLDRWQLKTPRSWKIDRDDYPKLEYKCQYNETDFAFFARLLEEAGIAFLLMQVDGVTTLVFSDKPTTHPLRKLPPVAYKDNHLEAMDRDYVEKVQLRHEVRPGAYQIADYDFRNPSFRLKGEAAKAVEPETAYERFEYEPGGFLIEAKGGDTPYADDKGAYRRDATFGASRAQRSLDAARTGKRYVQYQTNAIDLQPGSVFTVEGHPHESLAHPLLVQSFVLHAEPHTEWQMRGSATFTADPYRPAHGTPKPNVQGVQSATIVGPQGQEIHTDEFGRVRVQFPWDRVGEMNDNSSCWIRASQGWAGTGFGMINIPRIGQEVLVGFIDGDPDVPIVVGRVFNALNPVPYKLPDNKTISGWKTNSSPTNGGYNEIKLEDRATKELVYIQAQRDLHALVKRDETYRIDRKHHRTVVDDQHFIVKKTKKELVEVDDHLHVQGDRFQQIDSSTSLKVAVDRDEVIGNKHALDVGKEIHMKSGHDIVIEAGDSLTIKASGGFIRIHETGVDIVGLIVNINSGGTPGVGSGSKPTAPKDAEEAFPKDRWEDIGD